MLKVGHVRAGLAVQAVVVHHLVVVHHVGDDLVDFGFINAIGDVLAVVGGRSEGAVGRC